MKIGDIADNVTDQSSPGELFRDNWLGSIPEAQWPSYIDESADLLQYGIGIGETNLTKADFASETGEYYREGLGKSMSVDYEETTLPLGYVSGRKVGLVAWMLTELQREIRSSKTTNFKSSSRALEAIVNKALLQSFEGDDSLDAKGIDRIRLPKSVAVSDLVSEIFCRPRSPQYVEAIVEVATGYRRSTKSLLELVEEPQMVTPFWEHQRKALSRWLKNDCRGYVDMATATGKTVLGLGAIAHHFGKLHPIDRELTEPNLQPSDQRGTVLVVAHRTVILEQWKREFDHRLNIPEASTTTGGEETVSFSWGDVHFWTPKRVLQRGVPDADLVVLDETHHYLGDSGFGSILNEFDGDVVALSGSIDETNARTLERRNIEKLLTFTLRDGQRAGIVPRCDWKVHLVPYEGQSVLTDVTERCQQGTERFSDGGPEDVMQELDRDPSEVAFETLHEARSVVQSTAGREIKKKHDGYREFSSAVKSRNLTKYNLSPELSEITNLVLESVTDHKCVVLLESGDEIETVVSGLRRELGDEFDDYIQVVWESADDTIEVVREFDENQKSGAIIGTASVLGEGVDIQTADVGINRARGRLSRSLVQRMGRILRNPDGDKEAEFHHIMGIPTTSTALLPQEDGIELLETASQLLAWGSSFEAQPTFETRSADVAETIWQLEREGANAIDDLAPHNYSWPSDREVRSHLEQLCADAIDAESSVLLALEDTSESVSSSPEESALNFVSGVEMEAIPIATDLWKKVSSTVADSRNWDDEQEFVAEAIREHLDEIDTPDLPVVGEDGTEEPRFVELNPVLYAVVQSKVVDGVNTSTIVRAAVERELRLGE
ncbi:DEAD/DEAH box helicase [Natronorubrum texcoconense]|uniref:Superfamily II DNA or RNA helicase n=1 Tax=Natronorubrum texcoconense TaxID=1095776 RepID=A0A1G8UZ12_9EURY|nr:DEAD/DEAH box helicase family protein [Natronorubrum texcoconense]SDJ58827.1 Superfamily II DNA or RNA helicase [Natronorubrum texcoconense]